MGKCPDAAEDAFGLTVRRPNYADGAVGMGGCVPEQEGGDYEALAALPTPSCSRKLILNKQFDEFFLVGVGRETQVFPEKIHGVGAGFLGFR